MLQAVDVLWTLQNEKEVLSEKELLQDYPLLMLSHNVSLGSFINQIRRKKKICIRLISNVGLRHKPV